MWLGLTAVSESNTAEFSEDHLLSDSRNCQIRRWVGEAVVGRLAAHIRRHSAEAYVQLEARPK